MARSFSLPTGWYRATVEQLVDHDLPPLLGPLTAATAWRYLYACCLWSEPVAGVPGRFLHLNDRLSQKAGRELAERGRQFLEANLLDQPVSDIEPHIDRIGRAYADEREYQGFARAFQRPNVIGLAFETTLQVLLEKISGVTPARTPRLRSLRGFELAPVGYHAEPDLALFSPKDFRLLISTKWTLRKDRIGTYLHEAYFYKQRRSDLQIAFALSEYNLNILEWLANDALVDRVYHAHLPMLLAVHRPFPGTPEDGSVAKERLVAVHPDPEVRGYRRWAALSARLFDLSGLFRDVEGLRDDAGSSGLGRNLDEDDDEDEEGLAALPEGVLTDASVRRPRRASTRRLDP